MRNGNRLSKVSKHLTAFALLILLTPPGSATEISRRRFLHGAGTLAAKSVLPGQGALTQVLSAVPPPTLSFDETYRYLLTLYPEEPLATVAEATPNFWSIWEFWRTHPESANAPSEFLPNFDNTMEGAKEFDALRRKLLSDMEIELQGRFDLSVGQVRAAINLLLSPEDFFDELNQHSSKLEHALPLSEEFFEIFLEYLGKISPDLLECLFTNMEEGIVYGLWDSTGVSNGAHNSIYYWQKLPNLHRQHYLRYEFSDLELGRASISHLPIDAEEAWPLFEQRYLKGIAQADFIRDRLQLLPESRWKAKLLGSTKTLREGFLEDIKNFGGRYRAVRIGSLRKNLLPPAEELEETSLETADGMSLEARAELNALISACDSALISPDVDRGYRDAEFAIEAHVAEAVQAPPGPRLTPAAEVNVLRDGRSTERGQVRELVVNPRPSDFVHADPQPIVRGD